MLSNEPDGACDAAPPTEVLPTGWYEVAIRVSIDGHDRLFFAREDTILRGRERRLSVARRARGGRAAALPGPRHAVGRRPLSCVPLGPRRSRPRRAAPAGDGSLAAWFPRRGVKYRHYFDVYERHPRAPRFGRASGEAFEHHCLRRGVPVSSATARLRARTRQPVFVAETG